MKKFKIIGTCVPEENYMVDISGKIGQIMQMIHQKDYFVINRPRQYGKTTTLSLLEQELLKTQVYLPIRLSFEGIGGRIFTTEERFCKEFIDLLANEIKPQDLQYSLLFREQIDQVSDFKSLSLKLTELISKSDKKIVLIIDEVDKSSDNLIFLYFLGMLRDKYLKSQEKKDHTFHSVILAGLHDIKTMKMSIYKSFPVSSQGDASAEEKYNSPWNIAVDFKVEMSFSPVEISTMLVDYVQVTGHQMDIPKVSEKIYFWTNGYPFLVSKLCKIVEEDILPQRENQNWDASDIDLAANILLKEINTLFEVFAKNLQNKPELSDFIESVILGKEELTFDLLNPVINFAYMYGMIRRDENDKIRIHNKIFEERMTNYYISKYNGKYSSVLSKIQEPYLKKNGRLDLEKILCKFQEVIKEKYSSDDVWKSDEFLENELRMMFLIFLKPIINGMGFAFKEVQTGAEKRLDIIVVFKDEKFVIELKIWRGDEAHQKGIQQLKRYMQAESVNKGYMLILVKKKEKDFMVERKNGILCVYV